MLGVSQTLHTFIRFSTVGRWFSSPRLRRSVRRILENEIRVIVQMFRLFFARTNTVAGRWVVSVAEGCQMALAEMDVQSRTSSWAWLRKHVHQPPNVDGIFKRQRFLTFQLKTTCFKSIFCCQCFVECAVCALKLCFRCRKEKRTNCRTSEQLVKEWFSESPIRLSVFTPVLIDPVAVCSCLHAMERRQVENLGSTNR